MIFKNTDNISLKELKRRNSKSTKSQEEAYNNYKKWLEEIDKVAIEKGVIKEDKHIVYFSLKAIVPSVLLIVICLMFAFNMGYNDITIVLFSIGVILVIEYTVLENKLKGLKSRTEKGIEHEKMWLAFKQFLLDFSRLEERDHKALVIWEHYLVYATGLGVAKKVLNELKIMYPTEFNDMNNTFGNYVIFNMIADDTSFNSFSSSFTTAASQAYTASSSSSGSGGGFSGGFGGGGGRRRSRRILEKKPLKLTF